MNPAYTAFLHTVIQEELKGAREEVKRARTRDEDLADVLKRRMLLRLPELLAVDHVSDMFTQDKLTERGWEGMRAMAASKT